MSCSPKHMYMQVHVIFTSRNREGGEGGRCSVSCSPKHRYMQVHVIFTRKGGGEGERETDLDLTICYRGRFSNSVQV